MDDVMSFWGAGRNGEIRREFRIAIALFDGLSYEGPHIHT